MKNENLLSCVWNSDAIAYLVNHRTPFIFKRATSCKMRIFFYGGSDLVEAIQRASIVHVNDETGSRNEEYFRNKLLHQGISAAIV
jgi:hypothetical protein